MSDVFALDEVGARSLADEAAANPVLPGDVSYGMWHGSLKSLGEGAMRGGTDIARLGELAGGAAAGLAEPLLGYRQGELTDQYFSLVDPTIKNAVDYWTPGPSEVGTAARVLGGLSEGLTMLAAGGGNPALMIGGSTATGAMSLAEQGVNPDVAAAGGILEGAANAVGFKMPFLGRSLLTRMASGAAGNLAIGRAATLAQQQLLAQTGNEKLAEGYNPWDMSGETLDALMGLAFGAIAHVGSPVRPLERDAALATLNAKHFQADTAPGEPADLASSVAHQAAIEQAIHQILRGDPVTPTAEIMGAGFVPTPRADRLPPLTSTATRAQQRAVELERLAEMDHIVQVLSGAKNRGIELATDLEHLDIERDKTSMALDIPLGRNITDKQRPIEDAFREQIGSDPDKAMAAYAKLPDAKGGKVLNTDTARELSAAYLKDRTLSAVVHEPASALVKYMYRRLLAQPPAEGEEPLVLFTGGGTGAGKSTAIKGALGNIALRAQIVYDTNMESAPSAIAKIQQALNAGKQVKVAYVFRDPVKALQFGALTRAMRQEAEFGSGRTVPIDTHIDTHVGSNEAIHEIAAHFADDPRVDISIIDNSGSKSNVGVISLADLPKIDYNSAREGSRQTLEAERAAGRISESVYRGFAGAVDHPAAKKSAGVGSGTGGQPKPQHSEQNPDGLKSPGAPKEGAPDPDVLSAQQLLADHPNFKVATGEFAPDGTPVTVGARELLARSQADIDEAQSQRAGYTAAVECALQRDAA